MTSALADCCKDWLKTKESFTVWANPKQSSPSFQTAVGHSSLFDPEQKRRSFNFDRPMHLSPEVRPVKNTMLNLQDCFLTNYTQRGRFKRIVWIIGAGTCCLSNTVKKALLFLLARKHSQAALWSLLVPRRFNRAKDGFTRNAAFETSFALLP